VVEGSTDLQDGSMPRPTKVWMVPLGRCPVEIVGDLRLEEDALLFTPRGEDTPATRISFEKLIRVKRLRASPVLIVRHTDGRDARVQTAFYFTQPPALTHIVKSRTPEPAATADPRSIPRPAPFGLGLRGPSKRKSVRTNATYLTQEASNRKRELQEWVEAIREAVGGS
jgi:hypothetical protein